MVNLAIILSMIFGALIWFKLEEKKFYSICHHCNKKIDADSHFCNFCGHKNINEKGEK